jgi:ribose transport system permease protein
VDRRKIKVNMFSGFLTALAAVVMVGRLAATPPNVAQGIELQAIAWVTIGGISFTGGSGVVTTALVMTMISNGLNYFGILPFFQQDLIGMAIIAVVWLDNIKSASS